MADQPPPGVGDMADQCDSEIDENLKTESCEKPSSTDVLSDTDTTTVTVENDLCGNQKEVSEDLIPGSAEQPKERGVEENPGDSPGYSAEQPKERGVEENPGDSPGYSAEQPKERGVEENPGDEEWLDILGSGDFKKKVIKCGSGIDSRPEQQSWVKANISCYYSSGDLIESHENFRFRLGDLDVIPGLEMAVPLMELGERAEILVPARLGYGKYGRKPDIPPESDLKFDVEILAVEGGDDDKLSFDERLKIGNEKKEQGNYWYGVGNYVSAIKCYQRSAEYLDGIDGSDNPPEKLQLILGIRINVNNNLAAAHLKMEGHDAALKSLDFVLKMQPNNVKAHFRKGKVLAAKGMTGDALAEMKIAAKLEPESKAIQLELQKLQQKKKVEDSAQKAMYQRMFGSTSETKSERKHWSWFSDYWNYWSLAAGGMAALAAGVVAYRQFHYAG